MLRASIVVGSLLLASVWLTSIVVADAGPPPEPGDLIREDPLTLGGVVNPWMCPTGTNMGEFVDEGLLMKVGGRCRDGVTSATTSTRLLGYYPVDSELQVEVRFVSGIDRASFDLQSRCTRDGKGFYSVGLSGRGGARLWAFYADPATGQVRSATILDTLPDQPNRFDPTAWNTLAIRSRGPSSWVLLNGQTILSGVDPNHQPSGECNPVIFGLSRSGSVDDDQESTIVLRNFRARDLAAAP